MSDKTKLLAGITVVEMGMYISAPSASRALADLGATVIKIENPGGGGDPSRWMRGGEFEYSPQFASWNRGKKSAALDVKSDEGRRALHTLLASADVLLDNVRPGVLDRLGLGTDALRALNPRLVHCTITGFGPTGPLAEQPGYDSVISARSGFYSELVPAGGNPSGPLFSDLLTGMRAVQLISAALVKQAKTGEGCRIDVPMIGTVTDFLGEAVAQLEAGTYTGNPLARQARVGMLACVGKDGKAFLLNIGERPEAFELLKTILDADGALDSPELATFQHRVDNYAELNRAVNALTVKRDRDEWLALCEEAKLPASPMLTLDEALKEPQAVHLGLVQDYVAADGRTMRLAAPGFLVDGVMAQGEGVAPRVGENTREVLEAAGIDEQDIAAITTTLTEADIPRREAIRRG
ncbi:CaiB/BaiF CoA transferase family protein [Homoserinimonas sp. A520]